MGVASSRMQNLDPKTLSAFMNIYEEITDFMSESPHSSLDLFLYPPNSSIDTFDMEAYATMLRTPVKTAYFLAKYRNFVNFRFFTKNSGILASSGKLQAIMPRFISKTIVRKDDGTILLGLELSDEALVYGIALLTANCSVPVASQIAKGLDGNAQKAEAFVIEKTKFDENHNIATLAMKFTGLKNGVSYNFYAVAGVYVPGEALVGENVISVTAVPRNPVEKQGRRVLVADE